MTESAASHGRFAAFGEIMLRISPPGRELLLQTPKLDVWIAGAEANVMSALARLGHDAAIISAVPDNALGDAAVETLRGHGVDCRMIRRAQGRMGLYWVESGAGLRPTRMIYDRCHSAFIELDPQAWDWESMLSGIGRLHLSGITPALGPNGSRAALAAADAATRLGVPISFDGNYRALLWESWDSTPRQTLRTLIGHADILFGNHRDIALVLGQTYSDDGASRRREAAQAAFAAFPGLRLIASTARHLENVDNHRMSARVDTPGEAFETEEVTLPGIVDRVGTGDAFAAGVLHAHRREEDIRAMARTGLALAALKHSIPGDVTPVRERDLDTMLEGGFHARR